ncbi:MAG: restriction endonuclease subunit S [Spirochaetes bacterium]|nr:restriction endonuclease subunit S [Spirochaetota bacterium]
MSKIKLCKAVKYVDERISVKNVPIENFVTVDNLIPNKGGITVAGNMPPQGGSLPLFRKDDILVGNIRPYLKKIWFSDREGGAAADVLIFNVKKEYYPKYIYYAMFRDDFFNHMMKGKKGTKMPRGDKNQIMEFLVPDFKYPTQQRIAAVLSVLDAKIELNNRINAELEAMAKTLYDYWFVQFDFPFDFASTPLSTGAQGKPDKNGKPYKSSGGKMIWNEELKREIPEGWEVAKLSNLVNITTGKLDSNAEVLGGKYPFFTCASEPATIDSYAFDDSVILVAGNNASGNFHINRYKGKFNAYQRTYVITAKDIEYLEYIYQVLIMETYLMKNRGNGSQTKFITLGMLTDIRVFSSISYVMNEFYKLTKSLFEEQMNYFLQNKTLSTLRDWLLPMLMNGQAKAV